MASELCQTVGDEFFFFTYHIFLEVDKTQDLLSKIWQTVEMLQPIYGILFSIILNT
jgi:hypothetical protein